MWSISHEVCWTPALEKRARREAHPPIGAARREHVERIRRHAHDRSLFMMEWEATARRFTHAVQDRDIAHSLRTLAGTLRTIEAIAERTRARRQQSAALHDAVRDALHRTSAQASWRMS